MTTDVCAELRDSDPCTQHKTRNPIAGAHIPSGNTDVLGSVQFCQQLSLNFYIINATK